MAKAPEFTVRVHTGRVYPENGQGAMFAWKPLYTAYLPLPRTDGRYVQQTTSKASLKFHCEQHLRRVLGYVPKFVLEYE